MLANHNYRYAWLIALLVVAAPAASEAANDGQPEPYFVAKEIGDAGTPQAALFLNGQTLDFRLDTGASMPLALFSNAAEQLALSLVEQAGARFANTEIRYALDENNRMSRPVTVPVFRSPAGLSEHGAIGWPTLRQRVWELDFPKGKLYFHDRLGDEAAAWQSFSISESKHGVLFVEVPDGQDMLKVMIDTGATSSLSLGGRAWRRWLDSHPEGWLTVVTTFSPAYKEYFRLRPMMVMAGAKLGDLDLGPSVVVRDGVTVSIDNREVDFDYVIGIQAFYNRRVIIDGPGGRVYFGPVQRKNRYPLEINRAQATFIPPGLEGGNPTAYAIPGGLAHRAGLRSGDILLRVNGKDAASWPDEKTVRPSEFFTQAPGTEVSLVVEREGEQVDLQVKLGRSPLDPDEPAEQP